MKSRGKGQSTTSTRAEVNHHKERKGTKARTKEVKAEERWGQAVNPARNRTWLYGRGKHAWKYAVGGSSR